MFLPRVFLFPSSFFFVGQVEDKHKEAKQKMAKIKEIQKMQEKGERPSSATSVSSIESLCLSPAGTPLANRKSGAAGAFGGKKKSSGTLGRTCVRVLVVGGWCVGGWCVGGWWLVVGATVLGCSFYYAIRTFKHIRLTLDLIVFLFSCQSRTVRIRAQTPHRLNVCGVVGTR